MSFFGDPVALMFSIRVAVEKVLNKAIEESEGKGLQANAIMTAMAATWASVMQRAELASSPLDAATKMRDFLNANIAAQTKGKN